LLFLAFFKFLMVPVAGLSAGVPGVTNGVVCISAVPFKHDVAVLLLLDFLLLRAFLLLLMFLLILVSLF
jgi:hypothetical protein